MITTWSFIYMKSVANNADMEVKICHNDLLTSFQFEGSSPQGRHKETASQYSNDTMSTKASKITGNSTVQPFVYANIKKHINVRVTDPLKGKPSFTGGFPARRASSTESVSTWWRLHVTTGIASEVSGTQNDIICCDITGISHVLIVLFKYQHSHHKASRNIWPFVRKQHDTNFLKSNE